MHRACDSCGRSGIGMTGRSNTGRTSGEVMTAMSDSPIIMTVETADGHTSLDNALNSWISRLQGVGVSGVCSGGVMAHGASSSMECKNASCAGPGVVEGVGIGAANVMTRNTGRSGGEIASITLQHIVGMSVSVEVGTVTAHAVAGSHRHNRGRCASVVSVSNAHEKSGGAIVTGSAGIMDLIVSGAQGDAGGRAGRTGMTAGAFR